MANEFKAKNGLLAPYAGVVHVDLDTAAVTTPAKARIWYNTADDTLNIGHDNGVVQQVGQEFFMPPCKNTSGVTIPNGSFVMATGAQGDKITIASAVTNGTVAPEYMIGVATRDITTGDEFAQIVTNGIVRDINTNAWTVGTILYPNPSVAGGWTSTKPTAPAIKTPIAIVLRQHANTGRIYVRMTNGSVLGGTDSNVQFGTLANNDLIVYNATTARWENKTVSEVIGSVGGGIQYYFSENPPVSSAAGDIWVESNTGVQYIYIDDGDSSQWVELGLSVAEGITPGGTTGQILAKASNANYDTEWVTPDSFSGYSGYSGYSGFSGYSGQNGSIGVDGVSGYSGYSGFSGYSGQDGSVGLDGASGISGWSGISGYSGYSGYSGFSGATGPTIYPSSGIPVSTGSAWGTSKTAPSGVVVGTTDTQTLSAKTITGLKETKVAMAANDIDLSAGNFFTKTISTATTLTVSNVPTTGTAASFILDLTNGGAGTITWWSGMKWAGGTAPTLTASGRDALGFFTHDGGTTWTGLLLGKDIK